MSPLTSRGLRHRSAPLAKTAMLRFGGYAAVRRLFPSRNVAILRYHAICGADGHAYADPSICVSPQAFDQHVRYLAANYSVLPLPEVVERLQQHRPLPPNCVSLTFDDGYEDNLAAARTLSMHGLSATFYITAGCMADGQPFWPAEVRALLRTVPGPRFELATPQSNVQIPLAVESDRRAAVRTVSKLFKAHPIPVRERLRDQLRAVAGNPPVPSPMLEWDQIREMARLGMNIGAHTLTHPNLPNAGLVDASVEITGSKRRLEDVLSTPVTMFSYPNGGAERHYTPELQRLVRTAGYAAATTSRNGFARPESDLYALERVQVHERLEDLVFALEVERFALAPQR